MAASSYGTGFCRSPPEAVFSTRLAEPMPLCAGHGTPTSPEALTSHLPRA